MTNGSNLDELRADGSWRLTWSGGRLDEAVFRLAPDPAAGRRALVRRLGTDAADPEQWEAALIEALLTDPAAAGLRRLELHLTDFHHSARRAAQALATRSRERLTILYFGHDFEHLYEHHHTSTGGVIDPLSRLHDGFVDDARNGMWQALPALRELTAAGGLLFDDIDSESLTDLRLRGALLAHGGIFPAKAPGLVTLQLEIRTDVFGTACPAEQLEELDPAGYPRLRHLDLGRSEFDAGDLGTLRALADSPILPQLETLRINSLRIQPYEADGDPLDALRGLAPAFAHLALSVAGEIEVAGATRADVIRVLPIANT
ncbi:hypothetical protein [Dactylosporangium salmoneum]|uniref:Leucine-rich repeat domain-containing protein n=1 Tax=Dactylosporangium salmoneum TaxID=53361 RepID=A0ABN3I6K1_9ACTN